MSAGAGEVDRPAIRRPNPYVALQREICGCGTFESKVLMGVVIAGPAMLLVAGWLAGLHGGLIALLVLLPTPTLGLALDLRRRSHWPAIDVLSWLNWQAAEVWRRHVGGSIPRNAAGARAWLETHPQGSVTDSARAAVLIVARRYTQARAAIAAMPETTPRDRLKRLELTLAIDAAEGRPIDTTAVDASIREDAEQSPEESAAHLAYHQALTDVDRGRDGTPALLVARASLGRMPSALVWRLWLVRFRYAAASFVVGVWLLVTVLVGLATSGGVVWF